MKIDILTIIYVKYNFSNYFILFLKVRNRVQVYKTKYLKPGFSTLAEFQFISDDYSKSFQFLILNYYFTLVADEPAAGRGKGAPATYGREIKTKTSRSRGAIKTRGEGENRP